MDTFYVTGMEKSPFAALYKGNMRGKNSEEVRSKYVVTQCKTEIKRQNF